ncbi:MAG: thermonuclease family protein [Parvibaculum sp.]|uniref:thermonuclease family protein n=1 Tax=Parvibaculum sp. TaxID=2024848 RepID=UPI002731D57F|nr:thermonuclease family protein [Parvibaculum sp.]MDP1625901.1 thermonuclease family protein [Parvibaculum sp.]MDP2149605.1 thermonuclease family protein [Parvibaculum sp.]
MRAYLAFAVLFAALFPPFAQAAERLAGPVEAEVVRVIDGDSLVVRARIWLGQTVETHVRLAGVDAPELRGKCEEEKRQAEAARAALASLTQGPVRLSDIETDKYGGRVLARIESAAHGDVATALVARGVVRAYDGGTRGGWCRLAGAMPLEAPDRP